MRRNSIFPLVRRPRLTIFFSGVSDGDRLSDLPDRSSIATDFPGSRCLYEVLPGFYEVEDDTTEDILAVQFIIDLDFTVSRSFSDSC